MPEWAWNLSLILGAIGLVVAAICVAYLVTHRD